MKRFQHEGNACSEHFEVLSGTRFHRREKLICWVASIPLYLNAVTFHFDCQVNVRALFLKKRSDETGL